MGADGGAFAVDGAGAAGALAAGAGCFGFVSELDELSEPRHRGHAGEPESERKDAGADERYTPGAGRAAGLVAHDLAATLPVGNRRSLIVRCERFTDG